MNSVLTNWIMQWVYSIFQKGLQCMQGCHSDIQGYAVFILCEWKLAALIEQIRGQNPNENTFEL